MKKHLPLLLASLFPAARLLGAAQPPAASTEPVPVSSMESPAPVIASTAPAGPVVASTGAWTAPSPSTAAALAPDLSTAPMSGVGQDSEIGLEYFKQKLLKGRQTLAKKEGAAGPATADGLAEGPVAALTLQETIEDVVFTNPAVEKARLDWLADVHAAKAAWGAYEPDVVAEYKRGDLEKQNTALETVQQFGNPDYFDQSNDYKLGVEGKFFSGATYNVGGTLTESKDNFAPRGQAQEFLGVTLTQPLVKGFLFGDNVAPIRAGRVERRIAFHTFRTQLMRILYETEAAYWALSYAEEKHRMAKDSVEIARKLVRDSQERVKTGKMSQLDLVEAQAGLADRMGAEADARQELVDAVNRLKVLLSSEKIKRDGWLRTATPMYEPDDKRPARPAAPDLDRVLQVQPDYQTRRNELEKADLVLKHQRSQSLPELDLEGSYGYSGLAPTREQAWDVLKDRDHHAWTAGVQLRVPLLGGVDGRNLTAAERLHKRSAQQALSSTEYDIASSLAALRRRVEAYRERIDSAKNVVDFRKRLLDVEFVRLDAGKSNARDVYQAEEKLADARRFQLDSLVRYREAETQLALVSGSLLADKGFERVQPDGGPVLSESLVRSRR